MNEISRSQFSIRFLLSLTVAVAIAVVAVNKFGLEACFPYILLVVLSVGLTMVGSWLVAGVKMAQDDPTRPKKLETFNDNYSASILVARLEENNIKATAVGGFVSGFQAESPGYVDVVVVQSQYDKAKLLLDKWNAESDEDESF